MAIIRSGGGMSVLIFVMLAGTSQMLLVGASDPDPLQDFCVADLSPKAPKVNGFPCRDRASVSAKDFVFTGFRVAGNTSDPVHAQATLAFVNQFPALNTQGVSHARLDFAVGGVIPPHSHPLGTETLFVLEGTVYTGFVSYDNVLYASTLEKGDLTIFPRGTLHFQINVGKGPAVTFNTLTGQNPGLLFTANQLFQTNIPSAVLETTFGISATAVKKLAGSIVPL